MNIAAQYLQTDGDLGYVVVEAGTSATARRRCWTSSAPSRARCGRGWSTEAQARAAHGVTLGRPCRQG